MKKRTMPPRRSESPGAFDLPKCVVDKPAIRGQTVNSLTGTLVFLSGRPDGDTPHAHVRTTRGYGT